MPLTGPIKPRYYINYTSIAPNPDSTTSSAVNEIVQCPKTGRLWIQQAGGFPYAYQQVLPYVRNDGTPTQIATQFVNNGGQLKAQNEAGTTGGSVNLFDNWVVSDTAITSPLLASGLGAQQAAPVFVAGDGAVSVGAQPVSVGLGNDITITNTAALTPITNLNFTPPEKGTYSISFFATFQHNNAFDMSIGIRYFAGASDNYVISSTSGSASGGNSWLSLSCHAVLTLDPNINATARFVVWPSAANVVLKALPAVTFPFAGIPVSPNSATRMVAVRVA